MIILGLGQFYPMGKDSIVFLDEITVDDLVYNYTKKDKNQKSQFAIKTGDYTLMHNPRPL